MEAWQADAIAGCGRCGRPEREHQVSGNPEDLAVWGWLAGCSGYVASRQAVSKVARQGRAPRRAVRCGRCGAAGHDKQNCPW
jgi:hypothetical protein